LQVDFLLAVGPRSQRAAATAERAGLRSVLWAADVEQAAKLLIPHLQRGDTLLLKASRGVGLDRLVNSLESWQSDT
jgi:UDP-N-acetylmuramyl pentapeptide synthase